MGQSHKTVAHLTYYVVQTYKSVRGAPGKISADEPMQARDEQHALRLVERYRDCRAGTVAFRRTGEPSAGEWEDAVILSRHGILPAEVDDLRHAIGSNG